MVNEEARHCDVIDPLAAYSGINLFPSAFGTLPDPSKLHDLGTDIDGIHKHLKSTVFGSFGTHFRCCFQFIFEVLFCFFSLDVLGDEFELVICSHGICKYASVRGGFLVVKLQLIG